MKKFLSHSEVIVLRDSDNIQPIADSFKPLYLKFAQQYAKYFGGIEEFLQDCLLKTLIVINKKDLTNKAKFSTFLTTSIRNMCIDMYRKNNKTIDNTYLVGDVKDYENLIAKQDNYKSDVTQYLNKLTPDELVIIEAYLNNKGIQKYAAEAIKMPKSTYGRKFNNIIEKLR